jgi:hypothetical protein
VRHEQSPARAHHDLAQDLRLTALPDLYGGIAQNAANKKDVSHADFHEDVLKAATHDVSGPAKY